VTIPSVRDLCVPVLRGALAENENPVDPYRERIIARAREEATTGYATTLSSGR
jgi:hypothetical protein